MTTPALAEVTEELVSALRRALSILEEAAAMAAVPVPREPETTEELHDEPAAEDDLGDRVRAALSAETVREVLQTQVLVDADPTVAGRVLDKIDAMRRDVIHQVDNIPFDDELKWTLALSYLELKAQWLQRQVRVCYEEMITGSCSPEVALEASAASYLMGLLEPLLDEDDLAKIQELFAAQTA